MALLNQTRDDEWYTEDLRFCVHHVPCTNPRFPYLVRDGKTNHIWHRADLADVEALLMSLQAEGVWQ